MRYLVPFIFRKYQNVVQFTVLPKRLQVVVFGWLFCMLAKAAFALADALPRDEMDSFWMHWAMAGVPGLGDASVPEVGCLFRLRCGGKPSRRARHPKA